jgi:hypothetical protein
MSAESGVLERKIGREADHYTKLLRCSQSHTLRAMALDASETSDLSAADMNQTERFSRKPFTPGQAAQVIHLVESELNAAPPRILPALQKSGAARRRRCFRVLRPLAPLAPA